MTAEAYIDADWTESKRQKILPHSIVLWLVEIFSWTSEIQVVVSKSSVEVDIEP